MAIPTIPTYRNSGSFGDLIYSLVIIPKLGTGNFQIPMGNLANACAKYHHLKIADLQPIHQPYFTDKHYDLLAPLLQRQPYINEVSKWYPGDPDPENLIDTDIFRAAIGKTHRCNYLEMFYQLFNIEYSGADLKRPWLEADPIKLKPFVIARTERYLPDAPTSISKWQKLAKKHNFVKNSVFIGTEQEHFRFQFEVGIPVPRVDIKDFKEMADIIAGCDHFFGNQTFALSLAIGLNKESTIEVRPMNNPRHNECYFKFRGNVHDL